MKTGYLLEHSMGTWVRTNTTILYVSKIPFVHELYQVWYSAQIIWRVTISLDNNILSKVLIRTPVRLFNEPESQLWQLSGLDIGIFFLHDHCFCLPQHIFITLTSQLLHITTTNTHHLTHVRFLSFTTTYLSPPFIHHQQHHHLFITILTTTHMAYSRAVSLLCSSCSQCLLVLVVGCVCIV